LTVNVPTLRNSEWQAVLDEAVPYLDRFQAKLDAISDDIRALEKFLTESGFRIDTRIGTRSFDEIGWAPLDKTWRLCHMESIDEGYELRPLIEMPAATRWEVADAIPQLIKRIAEVAGRSSGRSAPPEAAPNDDDIPF
jgi:hypothetical protein